MEIAVAMVKMGLEKECIPIPQLITLADVHMHAYMHMCAHLQNIYIFHCLNGILIKV